MAQPLPTGWVDTGIQASFTVSCKLQITLNPEGGSGMLGINGWYLYDASKPKQGPNDHCPDPATQFDGYHEARAWRSGFPDTEMYKSSYECSAGDKLDSPEFAFSETTGPFRLGMQITTPFPLPHPLFAQACTAEYAWFMDGYTAFDTKLGDLVAPTKYVYMFDTPQPSFAPIQADIGGLSFSGSNNRGRSGTVGIFSEMKLGDFSLDASELQLDWSGILEGSGSSVRVTSEATDFPNGSGAAAAHPYLFSFDINISKFDSGIGLPAQVVDNWLTQEQLNSDSTQKTPQADYISANNATQEYLVPWVTWPTKNKSFGGSNSFSIRPSWAADYQVLGQSFPLRTDNQHIPLDVAAPRKYSQGAIAGYFQPVTVNVIPTLSVHRPDGNDNPPSSWVSSDTDKLDVEENDDTSVFVVEATGAYVTRILRHHWRAWLEAAYDSHDMLVRYPKTKHNLYLSETPTELEDIWAWDTYGWAQVSINAPASGTLQLTVSGVYLSITDNYNTNFATPPDARRDAFDWEEDEFSFTYDLPLVSGANTLWVDLLFPDVRDPVGSGPVAVSRVDSLKLSGFGVGTYTLSQFDLKVREQGYVKCDFGPPVQRGDYDALVVSQDGAQCFGNIPDGTNKTEVGATGGGLRYVNIVNSDNAGVQDSQFSLQAFWEKINDVEGFTVTWNQSAADAALKDEEGNTLSVNLAQWTRPGGGHVPYDRFVNNQHQPKCSPRAGTIKIPNGLSFTFYSDWNYGYGALETLAATTEDERAPAGIPVGALWVDGDVEVAAGLTDASGYAVVPGVPANGTETFQLQQG